MAKASAPVRSCRLTLFTLLGHIITLSHAFVAVHKRYSNPRGTEAAWRKGVPCPSHREATIAQHDQIGTLQQRIEDRIQSNLDPKEAIAELEACNLVQEPNRDARFLGEWHVWYTDCPPPSNGKLGPFQGTASQVIEDNSMKSYQNLLKVPPRDWLTATLYGRWEDWDGVLHEKTPDLPSTSTDQEDWGARHWKVTFLRLEIKLLGLTLVNKVFPSSTSRVWRTTYLDDATRVVRAGKSGRVDDEYVFYTKRSPKPTL